MKKCSKCNEIKNFEDFKKDKSLKCGYRSWCKLCDKEYKSRCKDSIYKYNKDYYENNKLKIKKQRSIRDKEKRLKDPIFKITSNLRTRLNKALKGKNKSITTIKLLGCDLDFFIVYISEKFKNGMSWDNYGEWHIDHIMPCNSFDLSDPEQQKICFNYKNLQPLWAEDNIRKGAKIIDS